MLGVIGWPWLTGVSERDWLIDNTHSPRPPNTVIKYGKRSVASLDGRVYRLKTKTEEHKQAKQTDKKCYKWLHTFWSYIAVNQTYFHWSRDHNGLNYAVMNDLFSPN